MDVEQIARAALPFGLRGEQLQNHLLGSRVRSAESAYAASIARASATSRVAASWSKALQAAARSKDV